MQNPLYKVIIFRG